MLGVFPCDATYLLINRAFEENKDFFVGLCNCVYPNDDIDIYDHSFYHFRPDIFHSKMLEIYENNALKCNRKINIIESSNMDFPILFSRKSK